MPRRKEPLVTGEIYHVFNRGVEKRPIFENARHYQRFLDLLPFYTRSHHLKFSTLSGKEREEVISKKTGEKLVEILCYCLMPNHFHFTLRQEEEKGISRFIQRLTNSFSHYYSIKNQIQGHIFQDKFKAVHIEKDEQLLHLSRYIHLNPVTGNLVEKPEDYEFSSYNIYLGKETSEIVVPNIVLDNFKLSEDYEKFVLSRKEYQRSLERIKHLILE
jgi:putative transposase